MPQPLVSAQSERDQRESRRMGMPTQPVLDVMRRTMANLKFIENHSGPNGPYEVTQLINSFLGGLAHPWEAMCEDLNALPLSEVAERGWPKID
jgi:hypothetical protein